MSYKPFQIERVIKLEGAYRKDFNCKSSVYAYISKPVKRDGQYVKYAMLVISPQHGVMCLGDINSETKMFEDYDPKILTLALYTRANNQVVNQVFVPSKQLKKLKTLDDVLAIKGISVKIELIPE